MTGFGPSARSEGPFTPTSMSMTYLRRRLQPKPPNTTNNTTIRMIHPVVLMVPPVAFENRSQTVMVGITGAKCEG